MDRRPPAILCVAALSVLLVGCGGGSDGELVVQGVRVLEIVEVHETEWNLAPRSIRIERFGYYGLEGINDGSVTHALAIEGHGIDKRTGDIPPGGSATIAVLFRKAGTYSLTCPLPGHAQKGMKATVRVH